MDPSVITPRWQQDVQSVRPSLGDEHQSFWHGLVKDRSTQPPPTLKSALPTTREVCSICQPSDCARGEQDGKHQRSSHISNLPFLDCRLFTTESEPSRSCPTDA